MDGPQEVAADPKEILDGAVHRTGCGDPAAERRLACLAARGATFAPCARGGAGPSGGAVEESLSATYSLSLLLLCPQFRGSPAFRRFHDVGRGCSGRRHRRYGLRDARAVRESARDVVERVIVNINARGPSHTSRSGRPNGSRSVGPDVQAWEL
jgi:hypothetical protein